MLPELHAQRGQHLADVVVQLARQLLAFLFLGRDELLRELAHAALGFLGDAALLHRIAAPCGAAGRPPVSATSSSEQTAPSRAGG